jgi:hypothetical protein
MKDLLKMGWKSWKDAPPLNGIVKVMYLESSIFPKGAVVQADVEEVQCGVLGDSNPTLWISV